ncbi:hypothetical protein FK498_11455 [Elioraea sp. Yellowstone]|uniref:hypothetical protein n=1 Tax=Elioraea sp. Yellowstone TaxID=2592070 RepID=UPI00114ED6F7|nr:hypothetical protein [Elioraea sp. Yellowstone]TQF77715.1 hypothetical protein FK498_11455 [Elioraea sp. Yellowstone]
MSRLKGLIATQIDQAIERAIASYHAFARDEPHSTDPKEFAAHHAACKAALAHLDLLLKIARITETPAPGAGETPDDRLALIAEARSAIGAAAGDEDDE